MNFSKKHGITTAVSVAALILTASLLQAGTSFLSEAERPSPLVSKNKNSSAHQLQDTFREIFEIYKDSVVFISTEKTVQMRYKHPFTDDPFFRQFFGEQATTPKTRKQRGLGTGFIISSDGYICTNHHVIAEMDTVTITVGEKEYKAKVIGSDKMMDIALLKIEGKGKFKPVYMGDSDSVRIGDMVVAIGNPFGLDRTYTSGIVSGTGRRSVDASGNTHIQTDTSINQGNSGGPLINLDGEVIGMNRAIFSQSGGNIGIGFSIPINTIKSTLEDLKQYGKVKRGYIGVQISPLTEEFAKELGLNKIEGALVGGVEENSPAEKGGLRIKDVIIKVEDTDVKDYRDLINTVSKTPIGKTIRVTVWRDKTKLNLWLTIKERP